jgi:hypothetical protein
MINNIWQQGKGKEVPSYNNGKKTTTMCGGKQ